MMDHHRREKLVVAYKDGYRAVTDALAGATDTELDFDSGEGRWTVRQIVHHLADSEMTSAIRLRLLIASESPNIVGYNQDEYARRLYYSDRPIAAALAAFDAARRTSAEILDRLSEDEWLREGTHNEIGRYTVYKWLEIYAVHAHGHAEQIQAARAAAAAK